MACLYGQAELAEIIMKNSAKLNIDLNAKDNDGWTAFHFACKYGQLKIAEMLMNNYINVNIDLNAKDNDGLTAFHLA